MIRSRAPFRARRRSTLALLVLLCTSFGCESLVPWVGIPLADILKRFEPTSQAKFVRFKTLHDPEQMPGQRSRVLDWPYREGLTIAEATHPLTILAVGLYGEVFDDDLFDPLFNIAHV